MEKGAAAPTQGTQRSRCYSASLQSRAVVPPRGAEAHPHEWTDSVISGYHSIGPQYCLLQWLQSAEPLEWLPNRSRKLVMRDPPSAHLYLCTPNSKHLSPRSQTPAVSPIAGCPILALSSAALSCRSLNCSPGRQELQIKHYS